MKISFKGKNAFIDWAKKDISGEYKQSKQRKYFIICDTLYGQTTSTECAVVFTKTDVLYIKKLPEDQEIGHYSVFDDGSCIIFTENQFIIIGPDGKQIMKKKAPNGNMFWENDNMIACFGSADNGEDGELFIFRTDSREIIKQIVKTIVIKTPSEDEDENEDYLYGCDVESQFTGEKFIFVYDNEKNAIAFDAFGNKAEISDFEVAQIVYQKHEREHRQKVDRAKQQFEYWIKRNLKAEKAGDILDSARSKSEVKYYANKLEMLGEPIPVVQNDEEKVSTNRAKSVEPLYAERDEEAPTTQSKPEQSVAETKLVHPPMPQKKKGLWVKLFGKK